MFANFKYFMNFWKKETDKKTLNLKNYGEGFMEWYVWIGIKLLRTSEKGNKDPGFLILIALLDTIYERIDVGR